MSGLRAGRPLKTKPQNIMTKIVKYKTPRQTTYEYLQSNVTSIYTIFGTQQSKTSLYL